MAANGLGFTLERVDDLEVAREAWIDLSEAAGHPFASWEWNESWWRWFGEGRELYTFLCRDADNRVVAILPFYVASTRPLRIARFLGYGDLHSPVCAPEHRPLAARAMREATRSVAARCSLIVAERLPRDQGWHELVRGPVLETNHDPILRFDGMTWDEYMASRSRNFRSQLRRRERKMVNETGLTFRLCDRIEQVDGDMEILFRLHALRWGDTSTGVFEGTRASFHHDFARAAQQRGWLRLWIGEVDGEPVAAWYGWRFAGDEWYYQAGRDPRFDELGLGWVLLTHTVRAACEDGVRAYHFLAGAEEYKQRYTKEDPGSETRLVASGFGRTASAAIRLGASMPESIRRRITRAST